MKKTRERHRGLGRDPPVQPGPQAGTFAAQAAENARRPVHVLPGGRSPVLPGLARTPAPGCRAGRLDLRRPAPGKLRRLPDHGREISATTSTTSTRRSVAPCSLDVVRCATSIILASEQWKLTPSQATEHGPGLSGKLPRGGAQGRRKRFRTRDRSPRWPWPDPGNSGHRRPSPPRLSS